MKRRATVYECTACGVLTPEVLLSSLGGKVREPFRARDGSLAPGVRIMRVLCWWCRTFHPPEEVESCMKIPSRSAHQNGDGGSSSSALVPGLLAQYSELWAFLLGTDTVTGALRKSGSLSLKCSSALLGLTLNDAETGQYCFLQGRNLDDLLLMAEAGLGDGSLPWRVSSGAPSRRR